MNILKPKQYKLRIVCFKGEDMQLLDNREMLKFVATNRSLAGYYECVAVNGVGEPASAFIELDIVCTYNKFFFIHA